MCIAWPCPSTPASGGVLPGLASSLRPATWSQLVGLQGDPKDRAQATLYHLPVESVLEGGDDARLQEALVCAHQDQDVPERHILCGLCVEPDRF